MKIFQPNFSYGQNGGEMLKYWKHVSKITSLKSKMAAEVKLNMFKAQ